MDVDEEDHSGPIAEDDVVPDGADHGDRKQAREDDV
jgi:hypothetical protein